MPKQPVRNLPNKSTGAISIGTQSDAVVLSIRGRLDESTGELLREAITASGRVADCRCVVVDVSRADVVTAGGRRSLVGCVQLAARAGIGLRFRFGYRERVDAALASARAGPD